MLAGHRYTAGVLRDADLYSSLAMLYLIYIGVRGEAVGLLLWPAVVVHAILVVLLVRARLKEQKPPAA